MSLERLSTILMLFCGSASVVSFKISDFNILGNSSYYCFFLNTRTWCVELIWREKVVSFMVCYLQ